MPQHVFMIFLVLRLSLPLPQTPSISTNVYKCDDIGQWPVPNEMLGDRLIMNKRGEVYDCERPWRYEPS